MIPWHFLLTAAAVLAGTLWLAYHAPSESYDPTANASDHVENLLEDLRGS